MSKVKNTVSYECSNCSKITEVTYEQIAQQITLICRCSQRNRLIDKDGYYRKQIDNTDAADQRLKDALNKFR